MKILLVDNAVDSLKIAMHTFNLWNNRIYDYDDFRSLKIVIEFLHNAIELLLKAILILQDETSIYCDKQEDLIEIAKEKARKQNISLIESVIKDENIKTLDYSELLKKYYKYNTCLSIKYKDSLDRLGTYRNRIMHLGIDTNEDFAALIAVIHECFTLIIDNSFYVDLLEISEYFSYNDVIDTLEPWKEEYEDCLRELSTTIPSRKLSIFDKMIENVIVSSIFHKFLKYYNIILNDESKYEDDYIYLTFEHNGKIIELITFYDALYNYSILAQNVMGYHMVFCIMHFEGKICIYNKTVEYDKFEIDSIRKNEKREGVKIKPLTENNIRDCIVGTLKKTILCESWGNDFM